MHSGAVGSNTPGLRAAQSRERVDQLGEMAATFGSTFGLPTIDGRAPTFALTGDGVKPEVAARRLGHRGLPVWHGSL